MRVLGEPTIGSLWCQGLPPMPIAESYKDFGPQQLYAREREKNVFIQEEFSTLSMEHLGPLVFTTTDGMGRECLRYHSRLY